MLLWNKHQQKFLALTQSQSIISIYAKNVNTLWMHKTASGYDAFLKPGINYWWNYYLKQCTIKLSWTVSQTE